jgi:hypothetical protein
MKNHYICIINDHESLNNCVILVNAMGTVFFMYVKSRIMKFRSRPLLYILGQIVDSGL